MTSFQTLVSHRDLHKSISEVFAPRFIPFITPHHTFPLSFPALELFSALKIHSRSFQHITLKQNFIFDHFILHLFQLLCCSSDALQTHHSAYLAKFIFSLSVSVCVRERNFPLFAPLSLFPYLTTLDYKLCQALCYLLKIFYLHTQSWFLWEI